MNTEPEPKKRVTGADRVILRAQLREKYITGGSVRALAAEVGKSYGFIHRILTEGDDFALRDRGGRVGVARNNCRN
jgi:Helix-turn-helix domain